MPNPLGFNGFNFFLVYTQILPGWAPSYRDAIYFSPDLNRFHVNVMNVSLRITNYQIRICACPSYYPSSHSSSYFCFMWINSHCRHPHLFVHFKSAYDSISRDTQQKAAKRAIKSIWKELVYATMQEIVKSDSNNSERE